MSAKTLQVVAPEPAGEDVAGCAVAYFPSGAPAAARFTAAYRSAANLRHHLRLEGRAEAVTFAGQNFGGECAAPPPCQYALAVVDGETGRVAFQPLAGKRILRLDARVEGVDYGAPAWQAAEDTPETRADARTLLDNAFATQKRRRTTARITASRSVAADALPKAVEMAGYFSHAVQHELSSAQLSSRLSSCRNIPPHEPTAGTAARAYPIEGLCGRGVLDALPWRSLLGGLPIAEGAEAPAVHPYVQRRVASRVLGAGDKHEREAAARAAAYLSLLLTFATTAPRAFTTDWLTGREQGALGLPEQVAQHLVQRFSEADEPRSGAAATVGDQAGVKCRRTQALRDLLTSYILVVALHLDAFSLSYNDVAQALQVEPPKLVTHLGALGCRIRRPKGEPPQAVLMADVAADQTLAHFLPATYQRAKAAKKRT